MLLLSPMMELTSPAAGAIVLMVAGVYQWTPLEEACLRAVCLAERLSRRDLRPG